MILNLLVLVISAVAWITALWLVLFPGMAGLPNMAIAAAHIAPPVGVTLIGMALRHRLQFKRANEAQAREEQAQAERVSAREAARKAYDNEMRQRRFGCDCRMVVFSRVGLTTAMSLPDAGLPNVDIRPVDLTLDEGEQNGPLLDRLGPALDDALFSIYSACRASITFPIFVLPPAELPGEEVLAHLRAVHAAIAEQLMPDMDRLVALAPILFLPASDSVPGSILSLYESAPDMPGALILAFDSPYARTPADEDEFDDDPDEARTARERLAGNPSEAVVALMTTNAELPSMLKALSLNPAAGMSDSMTPFWEKAVQEGGALEALSRTVPQLRVELADLPILGRVHRAAIRQPDGARRGVLELTRTLQGALEQAQINAGLIDLPFTFPDTPPADEQKAKDPAETCSAIVHNAGSVDVAGKRLAALGGALYTFNIDLSPVDNDAVLNVVTRIGDMGRASGIGQLALALAYTAQNGAPALCAEFMADDSVATSFVIPAGFKSGNDQH